jgi:acyl carrier protein
MSDQEVMEKVVEIVKPYAKDKDALESVSLDTHFLGDLKINSARLVDVVLAFEDTFNIEVADEDADSVETVGDAVKLIQSKVG